MVIVLACAIAILFIGKRLCMSLIIWYFVTGIVIGHACLDWMAEEQMSLFADLGVILLMFTLGLEMSLKNLQSMKEIVLIGGIFHLTVTIVAVCTIMMAIGLPSNIALFVGFLVVHSSTAVIMNHYQNSGEMNTRHGKIALGLLIFQGLNVIPMMLMVPNLAGNSDTNLVGSSPEF
ncbi:MAG: cation:proton antiporter [Methanocalculaceae archaeon]|nr:cation:proton antiporter [Methanocalculaceae archaeon]